MPWYEMLVGFVTFCCVIGAVLFVRLSYRVYELEVMIGTLLLEQEQRAVEREMAEDEKPKHRTMWD